jgi:hypothetical protein
MTRKWSSLRRIANGCSSTCSLSDRTRAGVPDGNCAFRKAWTQRGAPPKHEATLWRAEAAAEEVVERVEVAASLGARDERTERCAACPYASGRAIRRFPKFR